MTIRPTPETDTFWVSDISENGRNNFARQLERQRDEAVKLLRGLWSVTESVTQGQERERKEEWHPKVHAFLARLDKEKQA